MKPIIKTSIETIRRAAATRGGLAKSTDAQLQRWWLTLDGQTRSDLTASHTGKVSHKNPEKRPPAADGKEDSSNDNTTESPRSICTDA